MIFSGIELLFFILGFISCLAMLGLISLNMKSRLDWKKGSIIGLGAFLLLFCIAWSVSSVLEGEPRAASMGIVVFGMPALILLTLGLRMALKKS
ncbi:hypothetical protein KDU71_18305 [Carboxylicivirga sediminis]|uniref:Dehalogenase n=1 Tax=Carboxylicivirga sediminis TaxID=2006564 RepID=A0A941F636_9BACT|nr:hypothetical protein [Carboxylicivirga sediminis]MBR8537528.1 hypothetical protein [Carboxylicivirga sediminis]